MVWTYIRFRKGENDHMAQLKLTADILAAALEGLEVQKQRLDTRISEIRQMLGGGANATSPAATGKPKRKVSAAARRRMAQAQKLRWKKIKQGPEPSQPAKPNAKPTPDDLASAKSSGT